MLKKDLEFTSKMVNHKRKKFHRKNTSFFTVFYSGLTVFNLYEILVLKPFESIEFFFFKVLTFICT
jgi:hypothetical protein